MYISNITHIVNHEKIFETGSRLIEFLTCSLQSAIYKNKDDDESLSYFLNLIRKEATVLDIGTHEDYLYAMLKMAKRTGKLVAFETDAGIFNYLSDKKETLHLKNVTIEHLALSEETEKVFPAFSPLKIKSDQVSGVKTGMNVETKETVAAKMLKDYCIKSNIKPEFLKINAKGNELSILNSISDLLKKFNPKILLRCEERHAGREKIFQTFRLLTDLKYKGYFILDTMNIPIRNFDFNIYQNPLSNFYCRDFIFE
jgi:FkbM family methyltransferase